MSLGNLISRRRAELGLSLAAVGNKASVSDQTVLNAERGRSLIDTQIRIARVLGVRVETILKAAMVDVGRMVKAA